MKWPNESQSGRVEALLAPFEVVPDDRDWSDADKLGRRARAGELALVAARNLKEEALRDLL